MLKRILLILSIFVFATYIFVGCSEKTNIKEENISKFIPNGNYKVSFKGSDMANELLFLMGDGTSYKTIGINGKGYYLEGFKVVDNELCIIDNIEIENIESIKSLADINSLNSNTEMNGDKVVILRTNPTELDTFRIVEKGKDLKLNNIQLKGEYIKVSEDKSTDESTIYVETYYSEGLGVVKYEVILDDTVMEFSELVKYEKLENFDLTK